MQPLERNDATHGQDEYLLSQGILQGQQSEQRVAFEAAGDMTATAEEPAPQQQPAPGPVPKT